SPWFRLVARTLPGYASPHYSIQTCDYVAVVAQTRDQSIILVRQYRPAVDADTLELPAGHVEAGETPEQAARKELLEETGYRADRFELLGTLAPDTGRLGNRMWCYFAADAILASDPAAAAEPGIDVVYFRGGPVELVAEAAFCCALSVAAVFLAVLRGRLLLP